MSNLMNQALHTVEIWCGRNSLTVNPSKTESILFTRKRNVQTSVALRLFGTNIKRVNTVKYLGVVLDSKLNFNYHIDTKIDKMRIAFWQCRKSFGMTWGLKSKMIYWIYAAIIRPTLVFACHVWWQRTEQVTTIGKLHKLQRMALVAITGSMRTTPSRAIEAFLGVSPLHLHIQYMAKRICI